MHRRRVSQHALWALLICALLLVATAWTSPRSQADASWLDVPTLIHSDSAPQAASEPAAPRPHAPCAERAEHPHSWALAAIPDALAPPVAQAAMERSELPLSSAVEPLFLRLCVLRL